MSKLLWDQTGERLYRTGTSHGVLFVRDDEGNYPAGVAWNGLTGVTEAPTGAEATAQYADNIKYLNLVSQEQWAGTINAFTYPDEFEACDGTVEATPGVKVGQQNRKTFGFSYETLLGNDVDGTDYGYEIHVVYGALAKPSQKTNATVNETPTAQTFAWDVTTTPVDVTGLKPASTLTITITSDTDADAVAALRAALYGTDGAAAYLPTPDEIIAMFDASVTSITPAKPTIAANVITIPAVTGAQYRINGRNVGTGAQPAITADVIASVVPKAGYEFPDTYDNTWNFPHT